MWSRNRNSSPGDHGAVGGRSSAGKVRRARVGAADRSQRRWDAPDSRTSKPQAAALSGGWQKRLAIVEALVQAPDILLLDEPTNHLDLAGIEWLEEVLEQAAFACVVISHDRYFLENVATEMAELSRVYPDGLLRVRGRYSTFLEKKEEFLHAQSKRQEALENLVHSEIEWLRRGAKARTRKSKARIDKAGELMEELADLNTRTRSSNCANRFLGHRPQDQAADRTAECRL